MLSGLLTSNGVTYVPKTKKLYHMDGCKQRLMEYKLKNGKLCKKIQSKNQYFKSSCKVVSFY